MKTKLVDYGLLLIIFILILVLLRIAQSETMNEQCGEYYLHGQCSYSVELEQMKVMDARLLTKHPVKDCNVKLTVSKEIAIFPRTEDSIQPIPD